MLVNSEDKAPAFLLANSNFDVWLTNVRGNLHGRYNVNLTVHQKAFWDFSFD